MKSPGGFLHFRRKRMKTDREIAAQYMPELMLDENDPFAIGAVGYTVFRETKQSGSFPKRIIKADWEKTECVIEYAVWFDYDIQHLYELEHIWVYVDKKGRTIWVEGSFHGKYLNEVRISDGMPALGKNGRVRVWMQPGKHAVLPDPALVKLVPGWYESCKSLAGVDGLAVPEIFRGGLPVLDKKMQEEVCRYIRKYYAFEPSMKFKKAFIDESMLMPWERLRESIPDRLAVQLKKMGILEKDKG